MAVEIINKPDESTVSDFKQFTGIIPYNVIAINPTLQELHDLGLTYMKAEPVYQRKFGERDSTLIDVWLKSVPTSKHPDLDVITKLTFFINNAVNVSANTGKTQYINEYGRTAWAVMPEDLDVNEYYINKDSRPAYRGEEDLYKFIFAWLNMTYDKDRKVFNPCRVDIKKTFEGDFTELQDIVKVAKSYVVKVLTGVKKHEGVDGTIKYFNSTYNKAFLKHNQKSVEGIKRFIAKNEYNEFKDAIYTYDIQEFVPDAAPDPEIENKAPIEDVF